ncbi:hypothetical protein ACTJ3Y_004814, partial [Salmonella enterica subsp. enterica serovar Infantis]
SDNYSLSIDQTIPDVLFLCLYEPEQHVLSDRVTGDNLWDQPAGLYERSSRGCVSALQDTHGMIVSRET